MHFNQCRMVEAGLITCQQCRRKFSLDEADGIAMIFGDGQFVGRCPHCGYEHEAGSKEKLQ